VHVSNHILTTQMELRGFITSSTQYKAVRMELSLCLSFYLRCSFGAYTVGTTAGFSIETMVALAP
jgi:hypothetical protein